MSTYRDNGLVIVAGAVIREGIWALWIGHGSVQP